MILKCDAKTDAIKMIILNQKEIRKNLIKSNSILRKEKDGLVFLAKLPKTG